jgi:alkanesulfonate monooxygenase
MSVELLWTLPTRVEPRPLFHPSVRDDRPGRFTAFDEYAQVARAAELSGFDGVVVPHDSEGDESWVLASFVARETPRLRVVTEFPPDLGTAVYAAKLALSFQRFFGDRLSWQIVLGGDADPRVGDGVTGAARDRRVEELLTVTRGAFAEAPFTFHGEFFDVDAGGFFDPTGTVPGLSGLVRSPSPHPRVVLAGERPEDLALSARFADLHLFDEARPDHLAREISHVRELAAGHGRSVAAGLRVSVVARDFDAEARRDLTRVTDTVQDGLVWSLPPTGTTHLPSFDASPTGLRGRYALVGSHDVVAEQLRAYAAIGVTTFVLDGLHPVADAYRFGEYVRPSALGSPVAAHAGGDA